jgi:lysozyme family protein
MIYNKYIDEILEKEGGYVDDPRDSGGETNYGITIAVARKYGYTGAMKNMPVAIARQIYKAMYWDSMKLDDVYRIAPLTASKLFDIGVNMGIGRAGEFIQTLLNVLNQGGKLYSDIRVDGSVGGQTISAIKSLTAKRGANADVVLEKGLKCLQGAFYINLSKKRPKDEDFVYGWLMNRV